MAEGMRPCPHCGQQIKSAAAKCRFCGEFVDDEDDELEDEEEEEQEEDAGAMKWVAPVNRSGFAILAGYLGILALVPIPFILYGFFGPGEADANVKKAVKILEIGSLINVALGAIAILMGLVAILMVFFSAKGGLGRGIFAILAGIVSIVLYWAVLTPWFIQNKVDVNRNPLPEKLQKQLEEAQKAGSAPTK